MLHRMDPHVAPGRRVLDAPERTVTYRHVPPAPLTPLIGRVAELNELAALLGQERVLTLTGPGGCGKTRLAHELAVGQVPGFAGGVAWVELATCADRRDVVLAVADSVDALESPGEPGLEAALRVLERRRSTLLVLDNAEHVLEAVAAVVATVVTRVAQVRVIVTSREPIGAVGEVVWRVPSLATPTVAGGAPATANTIVAFDAVALFADRARRARRGFAITDANAPAIAHICARLDGLPLAIELAAARVRNMPPERIAAQLDDRFRLLSGGPRTLLERQQTLQASMSWSEALLDGPERAVFRRLGVFVAGFTVDAASDVVSSFGDVDRYDVADLVARLVDKSLVQLDDQRDRYFLLDTIRSYAGQRLLETGEMGAARDAHATWCADWLAMLADDTAATDVNEWWDSRVAMIGRIDPEWPNCATALEWASPGSTLSLRLVAGLGDYWAVRQRATDSERYGMPAVVAGARDDPEWMPAILRLQSVRTNAGDPRFAELRDEAAGIAAGIGDRRAQIRLELARHLTMLMLVGPRADELDAVAAVRQEAYELREWYTAWNSSQSPAVILAAAGRLAESEAFVDGLTSARAGLVRSLGAQLGGDLAASIDLVTQASAQLDQRHGAMLDRVLAAFALAGAALASGDPELLTPLRLGDVDLATLPPGFVAAYAFASGVDHLLAGRVAEARAAFAERPPDVFPSWRLLGLRAAADLSLGERDAAEAAARQLESMVTDIDAPLYDSIVALVLADCAAPDDPNDALDHAHRALARATDAGLWPSAVDALESIGASLARAGRVRESARLLAGCRAARDALPLRFRFPHRARYVDDAVATVGSDPGWDEGRQLTLPELVELARRMRGERVRPTTGWASLTPTEQRAAELVAEGLTNPAIAERLLMSRATVKTHLVHVYAKLGIDNRAELAAVVAQRGRT